MAKKNQKGQKQPEQKTTPQPTAPAKPLELHEEDLEQVVGGGIIIYDFVIKGNNGGD